MYLQAEGELIDEIGKVDIQMYTLKIKYDKYSTESIRISSEILLSSHPLR